MDRWLWRGGSGRGTSLIMTTSSRQCWLSLWWLHSKAGLGESKLCRLIQRNFKMLNVSESSTFPSTLMLKISDLCIITGHMLPSSTLFTSSSSPSSWSISLLVLSSLLSNLRVNQPSNTASLTKIRYHTKQKQLHMTRKCIHFNISEELHWVCSKHQACEEIHS